MSIHLHPSGRLPTPGLPQASTPTTTGTVPEVGQTLADAVNPSTGGTQAGKIAAQNRALLQDAADTIDHLNKRVLGLPDGPLVATVNNSISQLLDVADFLATTGACSPAGLSVQQLATLRDHVSMMQRAGTALRAAQRDIGSADGGTPSGREKLAVTNELLKLTQTLTAALRASLEDMPGNTPDGHLIWSKNEHMDLATLMHGMDSGATPLSEPARRILIASENWHAHHASDAARALARLPSAMLMSRHDRASIAMQYDFVHGQLTMVRQQMAILAKGDALAPFLAQQLDHFTGTLSSALSSLKCVMNVVEDYRSPSSVQSICDAKMIEIDAALAVLSAEGRNPEHLAKCLQQRRAAFEKLRNDPGNTDAVRLLGKPAVSGPSRLLHPFESIRQQRRLDHQVERMIADPRLISQQETLATVHFCETQLLARLLEADGIRKPAERLSSAIGDVLNQRPWDKISSRIVIPVAVSAAHDAHPVMTAIATSVVTPAGQVFSDPARIRFESGSGPINAATVKDYEHTTADGHKVVGGFNSHDTTEATHAVMAAHTELTMNGQVLLGATRTGINAPYELDAAHLRAMPVEEAAALIRSVAGSAHRNATRVWLANAVPADGTAPLTDTAPIPAPLRADFVRELGDDAETLLAEGGASEALVMAVAGNPALMGLLVRQAALNRVRETFLVELARSPDFAAQVAAGQSLSFVSVSLLTPDALRSALATQSPSMKEFDEKSMLECQVRAWQDLQAEIDAGGIVANGKAVQARIMAFNFGVNAGAVGDIARNPVLGEVVSGTAFANQLTNAAAMAQLIGPALTGGTGATGDSAVDRYQKRMAAELATLQAERNPSAATGARIARIRRDLQTVDQLRTQIADIWNTQSYTAAGNEPYKLVSRLMVLNHIMGGGSQFNCKSGKDRTGQLDVEAKFLAFQIEHNHGRVPKPDRQRTTLERLQFFSFVFQDEARRTMQAYATGYGGSKLAGVPSLYRNFLIDLAGQKEAVKRVIAEFMGLAHFTKA
ncbi:MAG: hypothetical protein RL404_2219 [Pseudomonadota bacterium]